MKNYITPNNVILGLDAEQIAQGLLPQGSIAIPTKYIPAQYPYLTLSSGKIVLDESKYNEFSYANTIATYNAATQKLLDTTAQSWGYDNMISAVSYMTSNNAQYAADGTALSDWRDAVWEEAYTIEAGTLPANVEEFLALLPPAPVRPVI